MNVTTTDTEAPPDTAIPVIQNPPGSHDYLFVVGFFLTTILLFTITYVSYICRRSRSRSRSPPPPSDTADVEASDRHLIRFTGGLDDDVLVTFPTSVYSETTMPHKFGTGTGTVVNGSGCSICLSDYMPADVVRVLPECGHLFHVGCVDTWLKAHATCPVCRNSPFAGVDKTHN
ncbi:hypothetical protein E3N88_03001 [Mikania micrantha]|uniref:RING-type domain-containing protein n=1 Tax=Mikania micrantha TaxID=192012 RepID=A0A5N6Q5D2_9ASTR|nr:hypothetical protein E3N88_03001 [Mikania micrantha]